MAHRQTQFARSTATRRGLTLLETLLASAVLLVLVTAVMSALSAGRAQSTHARQAIAASLSTEMLMARITGVDPNEFSSLDAWLAHFTNDADAGGWNGHLEQAGQLRAGRHPALPLLPISYQQCELHVDAARHIQLIPPPISTAVDGVEIIVEARTSNASTAARLVRFLPAPQHLVEASP